MAICSWLMAVDGNNVMKISIMKISVMAINVWRIEIMAKRMK
jgi:hypothetical protein